jgi:hypothetical protein
VICSWWWPKRTKDLVDEKVLHGVLKVVFTLTINTDINVTHISNTSPIIPQLNLDNIKRVETRIPAAAARQAV